MRINQTTELTIPIAVRRGPLIHLADGLAAAHSAVGPDGFTTQYLTRLTMDAGRELGELLGDEECELLLSTGQAIGGHFYATAESVTRSPVLRFVPS